MTDEQARLHGKSVPFSVISTLAILCCQCGYGQGEDFVDLPTRGLSANQSVKDGPCWMMLKELIHTH